MKQKQYAVNKRWRELNRDKWRVINRENQRRWLRERKLQRILEKHEEMLKDDPERLSTPFLQKLILGRNDEHEETGDENDVELHGGSG